MNLMRTSLLAPLVLVVSMLFASVFADVSAQMITGNWKGRINRQKVELKIVQKGDSLTGTSYYFESAANYRRYTIKGYFDAESGEAVWWDDRLIEEKSGRFNLSSPGRIAMLARADFNCPGGGRMMLDGKAVRKTEPEQSGGDLHFDKTDRSQFEDEWDYIIDNYTAGTNDPYLIDSVAAIAYQPVAAPPRPLPAVQTSTPARTAPVSTPPPATPPASNPVVQPDPPPPPVTASVKPVEQAGTNSSKKPIGTVTAQPQVLAPLPPPPPTIEQKFKLREKIFVKEIPLEGDSIELRFYDNAEIDGDSISVFLNEEILRSHIRLTAKAFSIKLAVADMAASNELTMVAENLGSIPPNTSYMLALVNGKRYEAYLSSSEGTSAMIRFTKKVP